MGKRNQGGKLGQLPAATVVATESRSTKKRLVADSRNNNNSSTIWNSSSRIPMEFQVWTKDATLAAPGEEVEKEPAHTKFMSAAAKEKLRHSNSSPCMLDLHGVLCAIIHYDFRPEGCGKKGTGDVALAVFLAKCLAFTQPEFDLAPGAVRQSRRTTPARGGSESSLHSGAIVSTKFTTKYAINATRSFTYVGYWGDISFAEHGVRSRARDEGMREAAANQLFWTTAMQPSMDAIPMKVGVNDNTLMFGMGYLGNFEGFVGILGPIPGDKKGSNKAVAHFIRAAVFAGHFDILMQTIGYLESTGFKVEDRVMHHLMNPCYSPSFKNWNDSQDGLFHIAVAGGSIQMVRYLYARYNEMQWKDHDDSWLSTPLIEKKWNEKSGTALQMAIQRADRDMIFTLVREFGAIVDAEESYLFALSYAGCGSIPDHYHQRFRQFPHWSSSTVSAALIPRKTMTVLKTLVQANRGRTTSSCSTSSSSGSGVPCCDDVFAVLSRLVVCREGEDLTLLHLLLTSPQAFDSLWVGQEDDRQDRLGRKLILYWASTASRSTGTLEGGGRVGPQTAVGLYPLQYWAMTNSPMHLYSALAAMSREDTQISSTFTGVAGGCCFSVFFPINQQSEAGGTALTWAAAGGYSEMVAMLLDLGALASLPDEEGYTALDWYRNYLDNLPEGEGGEEALLDEREPVINALEERMCFEKKSAGVTGDQPPEWQKVEVAVLRLVRGVDYVNLGKPPKEREDSYLSGSERQYGSWEDFYNSFFE